MSIKVNVLKGVVFSGLKINRPWILHYGEWRLEDAETGEKQKEAQPHLQVPKHSHCELCGAPVRYGMEFCNAEHKKLFQKKARKDRLMNAIPVIIVIVIAAASLLISIIMFSPP